MQQAWNMIYQLVYWPTLSCTHVVPLTLTMDVLGAVGAAHHTVLWDAAVHFQTHIAELPPLPVLVTWHAQGGGIPQLLVVLVFLELCKE